MEKEITTNELAKQIDTLGEHVKDLTIIVKAGFDAVDERFDVVDEKFNTIDERFVKNEQKIHSLAHMVAENGDAVAQLIQKFDAESAANQARFGRVETRLERIDQHLCLEPMID